MVGDKLREERSGVPPLLVLGAPGLGATYAGVDSLVGHAGPGQAFRNQKFGFSLLLLTEVSEVVLSCLQSGFLLLTRENPCTKLPTLGVPTSKVPGDPGGTDGKRPPRDRGVGRGGARGRGWATSRNRVQRDFGAGFWGRQSVLAYTCLRSKCLLSPRGPTVETSRKATGGLSGLTTPCDLHSLRYEFSNHLGTG